MTRKDPILKILKRISQHDSTYDPSSNTWSMLYLHIEATWAFKQQKLVLNDGINKELAAYPMPLCTENTS